MTNKPQLFKGKIVAAVLGSPIKLPLEDRVFSAILLCAILVSLAIFVGEVMGFLGGITKYSISGFVANLCFYTLCRRGVQRHLVFWGFLLFHCVLIFALWESGGPREDSAAFLCLALIGVVPAITSGRQTVFALLFITAIVIPLYGLTFAGLQTDVEKDGVDVVRQLSMLFGVLVFGGGVALSVYFVVLNYREEHKDVLHLNKKLEMINFELANHNIELKHALDEVKVLRGIIPICASCKNIRNDKGFYESIEEYFTNHSEVDFSHTLCDDCIRKLYPEVADGVIADIKRKQNETTTVPYKNGCK